MDLLLHRAYVQRILAITSASLSIASGLAVLIWWFAVPYWDNFKVNRILRDYENRRPSVLDQPYPVIRPPRKRKRIRQFRHDLTIALIILDLFKAIVLIIYPIRYLHSPTFVDGHSSTSFCDAVGFLNIATTQASDFAVLSLAIHTALLIFYPNVTGGLYHYRYYVYSVFFVLIPIICASVGMVGNSGYTFFTSWCYLVVEPIWYSLLLSWIPRLLIMILIISIYFSIYLYVKIHMYEVSKSVVQASVSTNSHSESGVYSLNNDSNDKSLKSVRRRVFRLPTRALRRIGRNIKIGASYLPGLGYLNPLVDAIRKQEQIQSADVNIMTRLSAPQSPLPENQAHRRSAIADAGNMTALINKDFQQQLNRENIDRFNHRRNIIERQVKSIFIYPITYVLLYIFPLIQQCLYYTMNSQSSSDKYIVEPLYWLALVAAWMKPFNCFVDTCVFVIREGAIPCLSPKRKTLQRNERYGAQTQPFTNSFPEELESSANVITTQPEPAVHRASVSYGQDSALSGHEENEYYPGADVEIDYIIGNSDNQNFSAMGPLDEENSFRSVQDPEADSRSRNDLIPNDSGPSPWFQRTYQTVVGTSINSVSNFLRSERQSQISRDRSVDMQTLDASSHHKTILVPAPPLNLDNSVPRWEEFSFVPLGTAISNPGSASPNPISPRCKTTAEWAQSVSSDTDNGLLAEPSRTHIPADDTDHYLTLRQNSSENHTSSPKASNPANSSPSRDNRSPSPGETPNTSNHASALNMPSRDEHPFIGKKIVRAATAPIRHITHLHNHGKPFIAQRRDQRGSNIQMSSLPMPLAATRNRANTEALVNAHSGNWPFGGHSSAGEPHHDRNDDNDHNANTDSDEMGLKEFLNML